MKALIVTAIYPTADNPGFGSYVRTQSQSLQRAGIDVEILVLRHRHRKLIYPLAIFQLRKRLARSSVDLVHAHYGLVGLIARTLCKMARSRLCVISAACLWPSVVPAVT